jgi:hypothetical protein
MFKNYITIKITLNTKDPDYDIKLKKYTDLAIAFDNIRVMNEISGLRKELGLYSEMSFKKYRGYLREIYNTRKLETLKQKIEQARKHAMLPIHFGRALMLATFCDFVTDESYEPVITEYNYNVIYEVSDSHDETKEVEESICHLIVGPMTRDVDVVNALNKYQEQLGNVAGGKTGYEYIPESNITKDALPAIKLIREWFLLKENGVSIEKIREHYASKCPYEDGHEDDTKEPKAGRKIRLPGCTCYGIRYITTQISNYRKLTLRHSIKRN